MKKIFTLLLVLFTAISFAKSKKIAPVSIVGKLNHTLLATGSRRIIILDKEGLVTWQYPAKNATDVQMLPNGNILFSDGKTVTEITRNKEVVFSFSSDVHPNDGTFFAQRLNNGNTVVSENSKSRILELDPKGKIVFTLNVGGKKQKPTHQNLRMVRKLANGNYLVCHSGKNLVKEYTAEGKVVWEKKTKGLAFAALRLKNGNTLISSLAEVTEYDPKGKEVWAFSTSTLPKHGIRNMTGMQLLPNGNLIIGCYSAYKGKKGFGLFEITKSKKLVWGYRNKSDKNSLSMQVLSDSPASLSLIR